MRLNLLVLLGGLAACDGTVPRQLRMDIVVSSSQLSFDAHHAATGSTCTNSFLPPGTSGGTTDVTWCWGQPIEWIDHLRLERGGEVLDERGWDPERGSGFQIDDLPARGAELVIATVDGEEIVLPLPAGPSPVPTIEEVVDNGTRTVVRWSAAPAAASAIVGLSGGLGGPRTHVAAGELAALRSFPPDSPWVGVSVQSFAAPILVETEVGTAHLWYGEITYSSLREE